MSTNLRRPTLPLAITVAALALMVLPSIASATVIFGEYARNSSQSMLTARERYLGRKFAIDHHYEHWSSVFPRAIDRWDASNGRTPLWSWKQAASSQITNGSFDGLIRQRALAVKAFGHRAIISFGSEMDRLATSQSPSAYIAAFKHVRAVFSRAGAHNVQWAWCPTGAGFHSGRAQKYYPGAASVDWVCADAFNWGNSRGRNEWRSFSQIVSSFYAWGSKTSKPLMLAEYGSVEGARGAKAQWFKDAESAIKSKFPRLRAIVYFDTVGHTQGHAINWEVSTSSSAYAAYRTMARDRYFTARS